MSKIAIQLNQVNIFRQQIPILKEVDFKIEEGEFVYLLGKTGSGKTSLLQTLYAEVSLQTGEGKVNETDLNALTFKSIPLFRRGLGIVFQDFKLLTDRTVDENLKFVLKATGWTDKVKIKKRIKEILTLLNLETKGFKMPHELSGGEQQKVAIARALLNKPKVILADEPTGNLDPDTSEQIIALFRRLSIEQNITVLLATHDYHVLEKFPSRVIRCQNGQVIDEVNNLS